MGKSSNVHETGNDFNQELNEILLAKPSVSYNYGVAVLPSVPYPESAIVPFKELLKKYPEKTASVDDKQQTLLQVLANKKQNSVLLRILINSFGANDLIKFYVNSRDIKGDTALHNSARNGNVNNLDFLLGKGAFIDGKNNSGETALLISIKNLKEKNMLFLLQKGANSNLENSNGETGISITHDINIVRILLEYGADIDKGGVSHTPLSKAVEDYSEHYGLDKIKFLLEHGSSYGFMILPDYDQAGQDSSLSIFEYVVRNHSLEVAKVFIQKLVQNGDTWRNYLDVYGGSENEDFNEALDTHEEACQEEWDRVKNTVLNQDRDPQEKEIRFSRLIKSPSFFSECFLNNLRLLPPSFNIYQKTVENIIIRSMKRYWLVKGISGELSYIKAKQGHVKELSEEQLLFFNKNNVFPLLKVPEELCLIIVNFINTPAALNNLASAVSVEKSYREAVNTMLMQAMSSSFDDLFDKFSESIKAGRLLPLPKEKPGDISAAQQPTAPAGFTGDPGALQSDFSYPESVRNTLDLPLPWQGRSSGPRN